MIETMNESAAMALGMPEDCSPIRLQDARTMPEEFGYLLRHYWTSATELRYVVVTEQHVPAERPRRQNDTVTQRMVRCDADVCAWRETVEMQDGRVDLSLAAPPATDRYRYTYNRSSQTLRRMEQDGIVHPTDESEARNLAFLRQPILTPLLPIPVGFTWHVANGDGFLDFRLRRTLFHRDMPLLLVQRSGQIVLDSIFRDGEVFSGCYLVRREGWTLYAPRRSMIVEDRTLDRILQADGLAAVEGTEIRTRTTLVRSAETDADSTLTPLVVPYETRSGNRYVYDCGTGRILRVDETVQRLLADDDIHSNETREDETAIAALEHFTEKGYFAPHAPTELGRVEKVACRNRVHDLDEFWKRNAMLLVLGITERCNLCCEYCCFSGGFEGQRTHASRSMSLETAQKAIAEYLENGQVGDGTCPITFYGGEPLLEYRLLRECVRYAVELADFLDKQVSFAITTNGTLLDDETVDFLVANDFLILVSLDGPKHCHDRYRVTASGEGSFDRVVGNLRRFVDRYPDYRKRGLNITLAPPLDLDATDGLLAEFLPDFPVSRASLVNTGPEYRFAASQETATRFGCHDAHACDGKSPRPIETFRKMETDDRAALQNLWEACMDAIAEYGIVEAGHRLPLGMLLFQQPISFYHHRSITKRAPEQVFFVPCLPGFSRRYCDAAGNYRVCERVDDSDFYILGNVNDGLDTTRMRRVLESRRACGDCGNCSALRTCDACFARIPGRVASGEASDSSFDLQCQRTRETSKRLFQTYTEIMERNPHAFDRPVGSGRDPSDVLRFGGPPNQAISVATEELD